jgi:recombination protein RecA
MAPNDRAATKPGDREKSLETALAQIERQFGRGAIMRLGDDIRPPVEVIPTGSIALDVALGIGGLPRGRIVEIYGPEASGKTSLALHAIANAQKAGGIAAFIDAEHALDPDYAKNLGVDTDALLVSQPDTGEQALEIADMLIRSGAVDVIVIDSVAALVPRAEIEGEMGDSHVGLQARLMSQALRKVAGALNQTNTTAIFTNQLREKIGVMFGCGSWYTYVTLADGSRERIGKIVNQKMPVEVLSYDPELGKVVPKKVVNWFNNGATEEFLHFVVERSGGGSGHGRAIMDLTRNHLVRTPGGWREAGEISVGDRVMLAQPHLLSPSQQQLILGSVMGDGNLSRPVRRDDHSARFRMGHGARQAAYLDWKLSLLANIPHTRTVNANGAVFGDVTPLAELAELREAVYFGDGKKHLSWDYLKELTPLALAIWYMDDGCFTVRSKGVQERTRGGSGRVEICVEAMSPGSRERLLQYLRDTHGLDVRLRVSGARRVSYLVFTTSASEKFQRLVAPFVHPSMAYKLLPRLRGQFAVKPEFVEPVIRPVPAQVLDVSVKRDYPMMSRYDIEVEGSHNYFADGIMVHNSPETTTGGKALKFYASIRLDVRRIETLKDGTDAVGNRTRVKVVKNKVSPPFKTAEFDILYGVGISREGSLIDLGVEQAIVRKSGAWYTYEGDQLGQGKENARNFLRDNPDLANEIEKKIKEKLGIGARLDAAAPAPGPGGGPAPGPGSGPGGAAPGVNPAAGLKVVPGGGN